MSGRPIKRTLRALVKVAKNSAGVYVVSTVSSTSNPLRSVTHMLPKP